MEGVRLYHGYVMRDARNLEDHVRNVYDIWRVEIRVPSAAYVIMHALRVRTTEEEILMRA